MERMFHHNNLHNSISAWDNPLVVGYYRDASKFVCHTLYFIVDKSPKYIVRVNAMNPLRVHLKIREFAV